MARKVKKDFDKEKMYSKIMPSIVTPPPQTQGEEEPADLREPSEPAEQQQFVLRNFIEDIVMDKLERTMDMLRCCQCERCKKDVMAIALNDLPTAYTVVAPEQLEATVKQLRQSYEVKVSSALIKAVQTVKANPNHH